MRYCHIVGANCNNVGIGKDTVCLFTLLSQLPVMSVCILKGFLQFCECILVSGSGPETGNSPLPPRQHTVGSMRCLTTAANISAGKTA